MIDTSIKELCKTGCFNSELLFWATQFTPYLMRSRGSRKIQPQPLDVQEDTKSHELAAEAKQTSGPNLSRTVQDFIVECLQPWDRKDAPSSRDDINKAFPVCDKAAKEKGADVPADLNCLKYFASMGSDCWPCICWVAQINKWKIKGC
jgi:hypothetical protein